MILTGALLALLVAYFVLPALRPASVEEVEEFARLSEITTTKVSQVFIGHYLVTSRRLRTILVLAALFLPGLVGTALGWRGGDDGLPQAWQVAFAMCLAGTIWTELGLTRPSSSVRMASLRPREISGYLTGPLLWSPVVASGLALALWAGVPLVVRDRLDPANPPRVTFGGDLAGSGRTALAGALFAVAVPVTVFLAQRAIVARPQPYTAAGLVSADDAIRSASVRYLGAIGATMALLNVAGAAAQYVYAFDGPADLVTGSAVAVGLLLALFAWFARVPGRWWPSKPVHRPAGAS